MENKIDYRAELNKMAIIGSVFEGTAFDKAFKTTFDTAYQKLKDEKDPVTAFQLANKIATKESLKYLPVVMRVNYLLNTTFNNDITDESIDWKTVNEILTSNIEDVDYNGVKEVNSFEELKQLKISIECAMADLGPWITLKCKDCKEDFTMLFSEVNYFCSRNLHLPKRCSKCRKARKSGTEDKTSNKKILAKNVTKTLQRTEEELAKAIEESRKDREEFKTSSMSDAFKRLGL